jgi:ABC-type phosphate/phosphonate transport system ATPase subunit
MELLSAKLNQLDGSSAIIVSHDMHLSATFADMIIKIRKEGRKLSDVKDEITYYGVIDQTCVYTPSEDKSTWSNGIDSYNASEFEQFLKRI